MSSSEAGRRSNRDWLADLAAGSPARDGAIVDLRDYLLRAILVYLTRRRGELGRFDHDELRQFAEDWTQQALIQVLGGIETFRGDSRFTTWAYRVAVNLVAGDLRRRRWADQSLDELTESSSPDVAVRHDASALSPETEVGRQQIWEAIQTTLETALTERQRSALTRVLEGVPPEVIAEELGTTRNNVYKIVHDGRRKLRDALRALDMPEEDIVRAFEIGPGRD